MSDVLIDLNNAAMRAHRSAIDPGRAGLLVIDMQEYQVRKPWPCYQLMNGRVPGLLDYFHHQVEHIAEPNIVRLVHAARAAGVPIVFTKLASHQKDGRDLGGKIRGANELARHLIGKPFFPHQDDPAAAIIPSLAPQDADIVLTKTTSGAFSGTELDRLLKNMGVSQLILCGVVTNMCVESSARVGADLGFDVTVVSDACAAWSESVHVASLRSIEMVLCAVQKSDDVIDQLTKSAGEPPA
jgi:nicotinamidase-related amidase